MCARAPKDSVADVGGSGALVAQLNDNDTGALSHVLTERVLGV